MSDILTEIAKERRVQVGNPVYHYQKVEPVHPVIAVEPVKAYVLGFMFNAMNDVLLIKKTRPKWQEGLLNGIGGSVEAGETALQAMIRETQEETGLHFPDWTELGVMSGTGRAGKFTMTVFRGKNDRLLNHTYITEEGKVKFYDSREWRTQPRVDNLDILIPAALLNKHYLSLDYIGEPGAVDKDAG